MVDIESYRKCQVMPTILKTVTVIVGDALTRQCGICRAPIAAVCTYDGGMPCYGVHLERTKKDATTAPSDSGAMPDMQSQEKSQM